MDMSLQVGLNIVTLIMCILTLAMASAALMPQIKQALALLRDGLLWLMLISVIVFVGIVGWGRLLQARRQNAQISTGPAKIIVPANSLQIEPITPSPASAHDGSSTSVAVNGLVEGGMSTPNRSWPTNSRASAGGR